MEVEVGDNGRVTEIRPDPNHLISHGHSCPKGPLMAEVVNDPDRVTQPMRRKPDGTFEAVSWDEALGDIGRRLGEVIRVHGGESVGAYMGNSSAFNYGAFFWGSGLTAALGTRHSYSAASLDIHNYWAASAMLYGNPLTNPIPDVDRTDLLLVVGANPLVSGGGMVTMTPARERLKALVSRGARLVVVDPRRTETAKLGEHIGIHSDTDAYFMLSLLQVITSEGLVDRAQVERQATGLPFLEALVADWSPERTAAMTGIEPNHLRCLARDFAHAPSAVAYGRLGASVGRYSTLVNYLMQCLNLVTGNLDRPGGAVMGMPLIDIEDIAQKMGLTTYDTWRSRVDGFPELLGSGSSASLAREITTPGPGQLRALIVCCGNPASSVPDAPALQDALAELDLLVTIDLYITETGHHADYVLPGTAWMERDSYAWLDGPHHVTPFGQWAPKAAEPPGQCREEWWIFDQIARRIGLVASASPLVRGLGKLGLRMPADVSFDLFLRLGAQGDLFGLRRRGWSRKKLWARPGGVKLAEHCPTGVLRKRLAHKDRKVHLEHGRIALEATRLASGAVTDPDYPLRMFTLRELRSFNSWMHNSPTLMAGERRQTLRMSREDAEKARAFEGDTVRLSSQHGSIEVELTVDEDLMPGNVGLPHGWGHKGGWRRANGSIGANYNTLVPSDPQMQDPLSGNARFNGIPVRVDPISATPTGGGRARAAEDAR